MTASQRSEAREADSIGATMRRPIATAILAASTLSVVGAGCVASKTQAAARLDRRIAKLEAEEQRRAARLVELEADIEVAERALTRAQREARAAACRARRATVEATVTEAVAACGARVAEHEACVAHSEAQLSKGAAIGCGLGVLSTLVSGGVTAAVPLALCAGGAVAGKVSSERCGRAPTCLAGVEAQRKLAVRELEALDACIADGGDP